MSETEPTQDLGGLPSWYQEIFPAGPSDGFYQKFGSHSASFVDRGSHQLVVSFDNLSDAGNPRYDREPWARKFCADNGWSHLGVYAQPPSWFRDARLITFLEGPRDAGFFARFDRVAMVGTSMGGFGALTFCDLAPGATIVTFSPQTSLSAELVPWEKRFTKGRAMDWTLPYSDAATQTAPLDSMHVALFQTGNLTKLSCRFMGHHIALLWADMGVLKPVIEGCIEGTLTTHGFYKLMRQRHDASRNQRKVLTWLVQQDRPALTVRYCKAILSKCRAPT